MLNRYSPKKDRSSSYLHCEGAASSIENAGDAYQSPSLLSAGASAADIALLSTITNLLFALLLVKVPTLIRSGDSLKRTTVILGVISALGWFPLIIIPIIFRGISPFILILLWVISLVPGLLIGPLRDKWLSDIVPANRLGRYLSLRSIISAGTYISSFCIMGYLLDHFQQGIFNGFTITFLIAFSVSIVSLFLYLIIKMPVAIGEDAQSDMGLLAFIREARQSTLGTLIIFTAMIIFSASVSGAFFTVYMLKDLHFTYLTYTMVLSVGFLSRMAISYFGGRWVDNAGAVKVLRFASFLIPILPILWIFSSNVGYLMGTQVFAGLAWAIYDLSTQTYLYRASPPTKRLHYIIYQRSIVTLASALGPLLGALLLNVMFPIFGSPLLGVFLLSGAIGLVVVITILPKLKDAETNDQEYASAHVEGVEKFPVLPGQTEIQLYHQDKMERKETRSWLTSASQEIKRGSFYHPECWDTGASRPPRTVTENSRQDRLYRPDPRFQINLPPPTGDRG